MKKLFFLSLTVLLLSSGLVFTGQTGKICVATKEKSPEASVSDKAALAPYLMIFDEKGNLLETLDNPFKEKKLQAGFLMADYLPGKGITAVVGRDYCGDIIGVLKKKGITAYNFEGTAAEAAVKVAQGKVPEAKEEDTLVANHKVIKEALSNSEAKIAVAASGDTPGAPVNAGLASSPSFLIFDHKGHFLEKVENPYRSAGTPGPDIINYLFGKGAMIIVAVGFGPKIVDVMKEKKIWPVPFKGSAQDAVKSVLQSRNADKR
jgi:predicted Fe-Mo cluster-binding NifX family protein